MFASEVLKELNESAEAVDWDEALCRDESGVTTLLFFSDEIPDIRQAKSICLGCGLVEPCLAGALERREPAGVWGGELFANGRVLTQKRRRGRPPKNRPAESIQLTA
ncbi:MAG: WhiB family transcriptional regulator [Acidimicrobiales bacterium]